MPELAIDKTGRVVDMQRDRARRRLHRQLLPLYQVLIFVALLLSWYVLVATGVLPKLFFGEPLQVASRIWDWFATGTIYTHLFVTLVETLLSFAIGTFLGFVIGLWLGLSPFSSDLLDPFIKALNSMPRIIFAPIFAMWFGLGIYSKVALGVTVVFFVVFFNVVQGVREVSPVILANARMIGANSRQLLRYVYIPSAMGWVFSSLHISVGMAFAGAVVGEYLGSSKGVGYLILQAEGVFDTDTVFAGLIVLTVFALALDGVVTLIEKRLLSWRPNQAETQRL
jgi:NitT/TauT family transport system permease protein